jgi:hypothetical protein
VPRARAPVAPHPRRRRHVPHTRSHFIEECLPGQPDFSTITVDRASPVDNTTCSTDGAPFFPPIPHPPPVFFEFSGLASLAPVSSAVIDYRGTFHFRSHTNQLDP